MPDPREEITEALERLREGIDKICVDHESRLGKLEERIAILEDGRKDD
jgi:hypothetical protein